jgi:hypothetical protein
MIYRMAFEGRVWRNIYLMMMYTSTLFASFPFFGREAQVSIKFSIFAHFSCLPNPAADQSHFIKDLSKKISQSSKSNFANTHAILLLYHKHL